MQSKVRALAVAGVILVAIAGCGGPQKDATYSNASSLREAVIQSGVQCPGDAAKHDSQNKEDFIKCDSNLAIHVFDDEGSAGILTTLDEIQKTTYLKGQPWVIEGTADTLNQIKDKLGGSLTVP